MEKEFWRDSGRVCWIEFQRELERDLEKVGESSRENWRVNCGKSWGKTYRKSRVGEKVVVKRAFFQFALRLICAIVCGFAMFLKY